MLSVVSPAFVTPTIQSLTRITWIRFIHQCCFKWLVLRVATVRADRSDTQVSCAKHLWDIQGIFSNLASILSTVSSAITRRFDLGFCPATTLVLYLQFYEQFFRVIATYSNLQRIHALLLSRATCRVGITHEHLLIQRVCHMLHFDTGNNNMDEVMTADCTGRTGLDRDSWASLAG
jgi:hypothetical protein